MKVIYKMIPYYTPATQPLLYSIVPITCILCNKMDKTATIECWVSHGTDCFTFPHSLPLWNFLLISTVALVNVPSL